MASASGRGDSSEPAAGIEKATPTSVPLLKFAPSLGLAGVAVPSSAGRSLNRPGRLSTVRESYRHAPGQRENISIEIKPAGEVRRGTGLIASASGRISVGSVQRHASSGVDPDAAPLLPLPTLKSRGCDPGDLVLVDSFGRSPRECCAGSGGRRDALRIFQIEGFSV